MFAGIDLGYNDIKATIAARRVRFASAIGTPDRARFSLNGADEHALILTSPVHVLVGEAAVSQSRFLNRREDRRWIESQDWLTLFLAAVTELTPASVQLDLVTGLPVAYYDDKQIAVDRLIGEHHVQREGRNAQTITVRNVRCIPQPFGTLLAEVLNDDGQIVNPTLARGNVGVIDVGGKTCNLLSVNKLTEISRETASVNVGGWTLVRAVRDWLSREQPGLDDLRDHHLAAAIRERAIRAYGEPVVAFPRIIAEMAAELAGQIIAQASQLWNGGATLDAILVTGGGALLLGDAIRAHWKHARVVADPVFANATGYYRLARRSYSVKPQGAGV